VHDRIPRRGWLGGAAAAVAAAAARGGRPAAGGKPDLLTADFPPEPDPPPLPITDTHVHFWDLAKFRLPWLAGEPLLNRDYLWEDYLRATEGLNVVRAIYMEVDVDPSQQEEEAAEVVARCRRGDSILQAAVISGRPGSERFAQTMRRFAAMPEVKGVRQVLHGAATPRGYCLQAEFVRDVALLGELGLSFDLCLRPGELGDGARLARECPGTTFILDHCGNPEVFANDLELWKAGLGAIARHPHVYCKVSGIVASTRGRRWMPQDLAPIVDRVFAEFGPDRVIFGGDWPVCTLGAPLGAWVGALREVVRNRPLPDQRKLFHENAAVAYRLR
jgi:L-fuconolactonase